MIGFVLTRNIKIIRIYAVIAKNLQKITYRKFFIIVNYGVWKYIIFKGIDLKPDVIFMTITYKQMKNKNNSNPSVANQKPSKVPFQAYWKLKYQA